MKIYIIHYYYYFYIHTKNEYTKISWDKKNVFIIKRDKRQEKKRINEKYNEFMSNFFSLKIKRKPMRVRDYYNLWKTKKAMKRKIKIMLINIWFNYFFYSYFRLKMLSWFSRFFLVSIWSLFLKNLCNLIFYDKFR